MHIPDGFLDARTAAATLGLSAAGIGWAARRTRRGLLPGKIPLLGLTAAFIFAAQMVSFPIAAGTSGHLLGGVLAAVLVGPSAAVLALAAVVIVQCLVFADGGLTALGANLFNLALLAPVGGYAAYRAFRFVARGPAARLAAAAFACWCSVVIASFACAAELALSGTVRLDLIVPTLTGVHMLIGLGEAVITTLVLAAISASRPDLLREPAREKGSGKGSAIAYGLLFAVALALLVAPLASSRPDGLERTAERLGFSVQARPAPTPAPAAGYSIPGIGSPLLATALAGGAGTLAMFPIAFLLARAVTRRRSRSGGAPASPESVAPPGTSGR